MSVVARISECPWPDLVGWRPEGNIVTVHSTPADVAVPHPSPPSPGVIRRVIELTHQHLGMDVTYVSQFVGDRQVFPDYAGDAASFGVDADAGLPLGVTYCAQMVTGDLPNLIPDTSRDTRVSSFPATSRARIGSYIGVPLRLSDGSLYGSFCCASHHAQPDLSDRDVRFMEVLAELLVADLDRAHELDRTRAMIARVISDGDLAIALQPVVRLTDGSRIGAEALARFPAGVGNPATLFPAAISVGLSGELEELAATRALDLAGLLGPEEFLSINMSPTSVRRGIDLTARFPGVDPHRLIFEVTEHHAVDQYDVLRADLQELREQGIRIAIDDAGAGYASLYHVVQLAPDVIKIDRRLVDGAAGDRTRRSVIKGFVALARDIGATVIGEGVEERPDLEVLRRLGVDAAQGYLLGRPTLDHDSIRNGFGTFDLG